MNDRLFLLIEKAKLTHVPINVIDDPRGVQIHTYTEEEGTRKHKKEALKGRREKGVRKEGG